MQSSKMIIGITGSVGSGKTTIARIFSKYHFTRVDADEIGHQILRKDFIRRKKLIVEFGNEILGRNKDIDRKILGDIVFNNNKKLKALNSIMHPMITSEIKKQIKKIRQKCGNDARIIVDAPLLLETKTKALVDKIIVVKSRKEKIIQRLRGKYPKDRIEKILNAQMKPDARLKHADYVIDNDGDFRHLETQVKRIIGKIEIKK